MSRFLPFLLLLAFGLQGCKGVPGEDVVGTWVMTDDSRTSLKPEVGDATARIVVNADGSFVASELPEQVPPVVRADGKIVFQIRLDSGSGQWKLVHEDGRQDLLLAFDTLSSTDNSLHGTYGLPVRISRWFSKMSLSYSFGDPDDGRNVVFERK